MESTPKLGAYVQSEYIIEVVNSLPFNPKETDFIHKIKSDGLIEIVLPWTDAGLGIVVRTTGHTYAETKKIAEILEEEYNFVG